MTSSQASPPRISASDRLGFTLFLALALHAIVVLGVGFTRQQGNQQDQLPSLDIIVANSKSFEAVEDADFLAQENQQGGGNLDDKARPSAPVSADTPIDQKGLSDQARVELHKQQLSVNKLYFLTQNEADEQTSLERQQRTKDSSSKDASEVEQRQSKIARLQAEIRQMAIDYAKRPKVITLTASTRKAIEASYLATWVKKIEHTGNLNYPSEARLQNLEGRLRMSVRLNSRGEVVKVKITSSSGTTVLDEAAKRILRMAEPFAPFSDALKERADQIVIIRTWDFNSNRLDTNDEIS
ncbi:MAG: protein TonB [Planctomycetota bacterium]|jgi:protein TonB